MAALTVVVFLPALEGRFLNWDDDTNFLGNSRYRGLGLANLRWMFTDWSPLYIPLTWLTLGADYVLWGMDPRGYHATSILIHAANAALCFLVLGRLLRIARPEDDAVRLRLAAAAGALFFSLHPLRVESVAWITERRDVVCGFFSLLSVLMYLRMAEETDAVRRRRQLALSAAAFAASLLGKPVSMMLPAALLVLDVWPLKRHLREPRSRLLLEKLPFFALTAAAVALTAAGLRESSSFMAGERYPLSQMAAQPGLRLSFYLGKTVAPVGLTPLYPYDARIGLPQALGWAAVIGVSAVAFLFRRRLPALPAAWAAYLALLLPVGGFLQAGRHYAADRYSYVACLPFAALLAAGVTRLDGRRLPACAAAALVLALSPLTVRQCGYWKDSLTLWNRAIEVGPPHFLPHFNRGSARLEAGDLPGALQDYDRSLELNPAHEKSWSSRGVARERRGDAAGALRDYDEALRLKPDYGLALTNRGALRQRLGDAAGALRDAEEAILRDPRGGNGYVIRAGLRRARGDLAGAEADYDRAVELLPLSVEAVNNRGTLRMQTGRYREAFADFDRAAALSPRNASVLVGRGQARLLMGDGAGAAADFDAALRIAPADWPLRSDVEALLRRARGR